MAYSFSGSTLQMGIAHPNVMVALMVDPLADPPVALLASTTADSNGNFRLVWSGWGGRVAIGHMDNDGAIELQCKFSDYQQATLVSSRYAAIERLLPAFLYKLDEEAGPYKNAMAEIDLEVKTGWTAPGAGDHRKSSGFIALPGIQGNSDLSLQEVVADSGDGYLWLGDCTIFGTVKTGGTMGVSQHFAQFRTQGETEADNIVWALYLTAANVIQMFWENGAGVNNAADGTVALVANTEYNVIVSRDATAKTVDIWLNGVKETINYTNNATGGSGGKFMVMGQDHTTSSSGFRGIVHGIGGFARTITDIEAEIIYRSMESPYANAVLSLPNVAGFWPMDETAGTTIKDRSGNGNDGTYESVAFGSVVAPPGVGGNGITLDGTISGLDLGSHVYDGADPLAMGAWFQVQTLEDWNRFLYWVNADESNRLSLSEHTTDLTFQAWLVNTTLGNGNVAGTFKTGYWFHLVLAYDPDSREVEVWLNAQLLNSFVSDYIVLSDTYDFLIGRNPGSTNFMHADVRGAFLAYTKLGLSDLMTLYHSGYESALEHEVLDDRLCHYKFDNPVLSGLSDDEIDTVYDEMGNFDGTGPSNVNLKIKPSRFKSLCPYSIGNHGTNIDLGDIFSGGTLTGMTITLWFKTPISDQQGCLVGKWEAYSDERVFKIWWEDSPKTMRFQVSSLGTDLAAERADIVENFDDDQWHFLAARFVASTSIELSIDGGPWASAATPGVMHSSTQTCYLFDGDYSATEDWKGYLEDVRIHDAALSDARIAQIQASYQDH